MPLGMDSLLRGIKQLGSGLKFTIDKELCSTPVYTAYKGRYKEFKVTVFKYKGEFAELAAEGYPLLKHITHKVLSKVHTGQRTGGSFYLVTERVVPLSEEDRRNKEFYGLILRKVAQCNAKIQNEHSIRICTLNSSRVEGTEVYFTEEGCPVVAGVLPRFTQSPADAPAQTEDIDRLDELVERYEKLSKAEQQMTCDLIKECRNVLPQTYAQYIACMLVKSMGLEGGDPEQKIQNAKAVLLLKTKTPSVCLLFTVKYPQVRIHALKHLQNKKAYATSEVVSTVFEELCVGLVCTDEQVRKETIHTLPYLVGQMTGKQKAKVLTSVSALIKKGKGREKEEASTFVLKEHTEFLEAPDILYTCMGWMVYSTDPQVKKNGLYLVEKLKDLINVRTLVLEVIPLVSTQSVFIEVAEQALALLCTLSERARKNMAQLKASDTWKVPVLGEISKPPPLQIDSKTVHRIKEQKEKEKSCWEDQEW
ncbi:hypothetical protein NECID01_1938 [Nematocida sp. AWRm77]|nr:hypothetical protein NECID01_1938 [Nematocida sp. AWRm77]